ncbi:NAD-dependent succinate-semialdehyde dehydrogenase [Patescibacteria group bacterium]|nr:NAD-dependent succinate-semialdehyde dehydrogenase [Patescibacteria group bacterium]
MPFISKNPFTLKVEAEYQEISSSELDNKLALAAQAFTAWSALSYKERAEHLNELAAYLRSHKEDLGFIITKEMGKPLAAANSEVEKSAWVLEYYAEAGEDLLNKEVIKTDAGSSYVVFEPLGVILGVMPWNFPFWQVFRFVAPTLMAGNTVVVKHASNVPQSAELIAKVFKDSGCPENIYQNLLIGSTRVAEVIKDDRIQGVSLTGSEAAGQSVAAIAGQAIKKSVLELGGSDPFIVLQEADVDLSCQVAVTARLNNAGQTCISAKRFIVEEPVYDQFVSQLLKHYQNLIVGDPENKETNVGPLATEQILLEVEKQVDLSVKLGAKILCGGRRLAKTGYFYQPTILTDVKPGMPAYEEEVFGPVAAVIKVKNSAEAITIANDTRFGLGASLWTKDEKLIQELVPQIKAGSVFVNSMVKSDPRLPFGGIKKSGYGREMGAYGIKAFTNIKTVWIK